MEKKVMVAKLIATYERVYGVSAGSNIYELSERIRLKTDLSPIVDKVNATFTKWLTPEEIAVIETEGYAIVAITYADSSDEKVAWPIAGKTSENKWMRERIKIDGKWTMSIHGGDIRTCKPDEVYLRRLASANNFTFGGIINE